MSALGPKPIHVTFFDGDQTNCFPNAVHAFSWADLQTFYRGLGSKAPGKAKSSQGYAVFARFRPATDATIARLVAHRRSKGYTDWTPNTKQEEALRKFGYRNADHLIEATALVCDVDEYPTVPPNWNPDSWPCPVFAHTSHNYHPVKEPGRWRAILHLAGPIAAAAYTTHRRAVQPLLPPGCFIRAAHQPAFLPTCPEGQEIEYA